MQKVSLQNVVMVVAAVVRVCVWEGEGLRDGRMKEGAFFLNFDSNALPSRFFSQPL